jgi:acetyl-CoA C-acetyltransferase
VTSGTDGPANERSDDIYIVDALRTPRGRGNARGALSGMTPVALLADLARHLREKHALDTAALGEALIGCVGQTGAQGANVGRAALLEAGYSDAVGVGMVNRFCTSSLTAAILGALRAATDDTLVIAAGVEMLSRVALAADAGPLTHDLALQQRQSILPLGVAADVLAQLAGLTRADCDGWALASQRRAAAAAARGPAPSMVPVAGLALDETPRPDTTAESLAKLPAVFAEVGALGFDDLAKRHCSLPEIVHVHTVGSAPAACDAASIALLGTARALERHRLTPRARIVASVELGSDRTLGLDGTIAATRRVLARAGLSSSDLDTIEVNEAFAGPTLHYVRELGLPADQVNPDGGAIALGHPMGATGLVLLSTALDTLERTGGRFALITLAGATGLASAMIVERV